MKANADILFEVSWEVTNKVGGIYTVVSSKAAITKEYYKSYYLIGPYFRDKSKTEFEEKKIPEEFKNIFEKLKKEGIICYFGKWLIKSEPETILIDFQGLINNKNNLKRWYWDNYKIDSLYSKWDFEEPMLWATAVARFLEEFYNANKEKKIVAHFHEWLAGFGLLHLKKHDAKIATVFTTHATFLGRVIAGTGRDLYGMLDKINPDEEAFRNGVQDKFLTEKSCANTSDVFTTVSEITSIEAEKILRKKAEILLLNGLDSSKFPTVEELSIKHITCREKIKEFLIFHFFPYYIFDMNHLMIMFIVGRYEFKNKGIDIFIEALAKLNEKLRKEKSKKTIAVFFWIPQATKGMKTEVLENKNFYRHIKNYVTYNSDQILANIVHSFVSNKSLSTKHLFSDEFFQNMKRDIARFKRIGNPPMLTHNIADENNDPILKALLQHGLDNKEDDNVKTILYPVYMDGDDGLINLPYYDAMAGCHLGIFPSYYEPWGYTPLEAAALGVPSITTDLAGFGRFVQSKIKNDMDSGIFVLKRFGMDDKKVIEEFSDLLFKFSQRDKYDRTKNKLNAKELSSLADWKILITNYINAHNLALKKLGL